MATRVYPHPKLVVPQAVKVAGSAPDGGLDTTVTSKAAFTVDDHLAFLYGQAGSVVDEFGARQPAFAHGPIGGQAGAHDMKPGWRYAAEVLADNPTAYWRMGNPNYNWGIVGANVVASEINPAHTLGASNTGGAGPYGVTAADGVTSDGNRAAKMGASRTDYFAIAGLDIWSTGDHAYECWFYQSTAEKDITAGHMLFGSSHNVDGKPYIYFSEAFGAVKAIQFAARGNTGGGYGLTNTGWAYDAWNHVVVNWFNNAGGVNNGAAQVFVNGSLIGTSGPLGALGSAPAFGGLVGLWYQGTPVWGAKNTRIDEVAVYPATLSAARVAAHYAAR